MDNTQPTLEALAVAAQEAIANVKVTRDKAKPFLKALDKARAEVKAAQQAFEAFQQSKP